MHSSVFRSFGNGWSTRLKQDVSKCRSKSTMKSQSQGGVLRDWICAQDVRAALILDEEVDAELLDMVLTQGYGEDLSEVDVEKIGNDAFLIAYALAEPDRVVVQRNLETERAAELGRFLTYARPWVCHADDFELYRSLNFSTAER